MTKIAKSSIYDQGYRAGYSQGYEAGWLAALKYEDGYEPDVDEDEILLPDEDAFFEDSWWGGEV